MQPHRAFFLYINMAVVTSHENDLGSKTFGTSVVYLIIIKGYFQDVFTGRDLKSPP